MEAIFFRDSPYFYYLQETQSRRAPRIINYDSPQRSWLKINSNPDMQKKQKRKIKKNNNKKNKTEVESVQLGYTYIADMGKCPQDKCCLDKCRGDSCNLL